MLKVTELKIDRAKITHGQLNLRVGTHNHYALLIKFSDSVPSRFFYSFPKFLKKWFLLLLSFLTSDYSVINPNVGNFSSS